MWVAHIIHKDYSFASLSLFFPQKMHQFVL